MDSENLEDDRGVTHAGPPEAVEREVGLPLDPNLVITVKGGRRAGKEYLLSPPLGGSSGRAGRPWTRSYTWTSRTPG
jgi:hypothetical protein